MRFILACGLSFVILGLGACRSTPEGSADSSVAKESTWAGSMRSLRDSLGKIEPLLFDSKKFEDPKNQDTLAAEIKNLSNNSKSVTHNPTLVGRDPTVRFVASQFAQDLQRADESFALGKKSFARYQLMKVTSYCVECHTRMEQGPEFRLSKGEPFLKDLSAVDRAEYLIASRRFEEAFAGLMQSLKKADAQTPPWQLDKMARLALMIAVQQELNLEKTKTVLKTLEGNSATPFFLKAKVVTWRRSVANWQKEPAVQVDSLSQVRALTAAKTSEVDAMRSVNLILKNLSRELSLDELGESLYLAGQSYELLNEISPMALHENYYESCIRRAAKTKWGKLCYNRLAESIQFGYSGSGGVHIPIEVQMELDKLKKELE